MPVLLTLLCSRLGVIGRLVVAIVSLTVKNLDGLARLGLTEGRTVCLAAAVSANQTMLTLVPPDIAEGGVHVPVHCCAAVVRFMLPKAVMAAEGGLTAAAAFFFFFVRRIPEGGRLPAHILFSLIPR